MKTGETNILLGSNSIDRDVQLPTGDFVQILGEMYYRICQVDQMPPFFMSLVSGADHWLFIASNGGLTAGRTDADSALFPYETEDKITVHSEQTGSKTIIRVTRNDRHRAFTGRSGTFFAYEGLGSIYWHKGVGRASQA